MGQIIQTRSLPTKKIKEISERYKCHFTVVRIDENFSTESQQQISIDTRRDKTKQYSRTVKLKLYKGHYMYHFKKLLVTTFYLKHIDELPLKYPFTTQSQLQMIKSINPRTNEPIMNQTNGTNMMKTLRTMFDLNLF